VSETSETGSRREENPLALGVDIGGTAIKAAVVSGSGELLDRMQAPSPRNAESVRSFVHSALKQANAPLLGIGIAC